MRSPERDRLYLGLGLLGLCCRLARSLGALYVSVVVVRGAVISSWGTDMRSCFLLVVRVRDRCMEFGPLLGM